MHDVRTTASEQHGRDLPAERSVWNVDITTPAIVLGSRQTETELDLDACIHLGVRRSYQSLPLHISLLT